MMKLYEKKTEHGKTVEWWTQRNRFGFYFSIIPTKDGYNVVVNNEDFNRKVYGHAASFSKAEKLLRVAEEAYGQNRPGEQCVGCRFHNPRECRCNKFEPCQKGR